MNSMPPKLARSLLKVFCDPSFHEEVEGDLDELFAYNLRHVGKRKARLRYWGDVFKHFNRYFITRRSSYNSSQNMFDMWTSYLKIALRNLLKNKRYSALNIFGLAIGMACAILIMIYSLHELSFDRFHEKAERTYLVYTEFAGEDIAISSAPNAMIPTLLREFPEVETGTRIFNRGAYNPYTVKYEEHIFKEDRLFHADSTFFNVFSFELIKGDRQKCLSAPKSVVLTEEMALKYFGDADPMGKVLRIDNRSDYLVTGVVENIPDNSHFHFDFLVSYNSFTNPFFLNERWDNASYVSYIVLRDAASAEKIEAQLPELVERVSEKKQDWRFTLNPLLEVHLSGLGVNFGLEAQNEMKYLYIFGFIGVLILTIASINYTNLATARAVFRAKEIGMRKVLGAYRSNLFSQFMGESLMIVGVSVLVAFVLALLALPYFNDLASRNFVAADLWQFRTLSWILIIAGFVGILAGSYPALVLSGFRPIHVLKGSFKNSRTGVFMRKTLVISQFVISIALIIGTIVVFKQLGFMQQKELGYNNDNLLMLPLSSSITKNYPAFKAEMLREPGILDVTLASDSPTKIESGYSITIKDLDVEKEVNVAGLRADRDFLGTMQMEVIAGSFITEADIASISSKIPYEERRFAFVLNEEALVPFGLSPEEAIGKRAYMNGRNGFIRGVVRNFHFASLREKIQPMAFLPEKDFNKVLIRISGQHIESTLSKVQERWRRLAPDVPFEYDFMDDEYKNLYNAEQRLSSLFGTFALLAIFIACVGLLGLVSFTTVQKAREIGVRKVLGASVGNLVLMLNKGFIRLVLLAFVVAAPLAYFLMRGWLNEFEYRVQIGFWPILIAIGVTAVIAFMTVSIQSFRAAVSNPVDVLKEE